MPSEVQNSMEGIISTVPEELSSASEELEEVRFFIYPQIKPTDTIYDIALNQPPVGWLDTFTKALPALKIISKGILKYEEKYGPSYPSRELLFEAFRLTPLSTVKVVIIGQDPYPQTRSSGQPRAIGSSFSVSRDDEIPVSLKVMFKELAATIPEFQQPEHGNLEAWQRQGVLLLNTCLTVKPGEPNSHGIVWKSFIAVVLESISKERPGAIFLLLGRESQRLKQMIPKMEVIEGPHPAARGNLFEGCDVFRKVNIALNAQGE